MKSTYPKQQRHPLSARNERRAIKNEVSQYWVNRTLVVVHLYYKQGEGYIMKTKMFF